MEFTDQVDPVDDVDLFVEAIVECFSDPAPWGYKIEGNPELRPTIRRMITAGYAQGVVKRDDIEFGYNKMGE